MQKKKKSKRKQTDSIVKRIIDMRAIILFVGVILFFPGIILKGEVKDYLLNNDAIKKQAVIVNEENYWGNSPISHTFSYSYEFFVDRKRYISDSRDVDLNIGDTIWIEYVPSYPNFSRVCDEK